MEFKLINPKEENGFLSAIEFNFEELKTELTNRLEKYQNLTYTEETVKNAKEDRAGLNKFKEAIETRRKEIKKLCLKPYEDFEAKVKVLTKLIDEPIAAIDTQIKNFDNQRIAAKRQDITDFYNSVIGDLSNILPLDRIFNTKWLNVTTKMSAIEKEIIETIGKVNGNLAVIKDLGLEQDLELQVKDKYLQTLDFGLAMAEKTRLENLKTALKAQENKQDDDLHQETEKQVVKENLTAENDVIVTPIPVKIHYIEFYAKGTKEQLLKLQSFMKENGIEYGGISKCQSQIA
jgi:hypothetical protein